MSVQPAAPELTARDYKSSVKPVWCPGCGDFSVLSAITKALTELGLQISTAKISTFGEQVVDVFYVRDAYGLNVTKPSRIEAIRLRLLATLRDPDEDRAAAE